MFNKPRITQATANAIFLGIVVILFVVVFFAMGYLVRKVEAGERSTIFNHHHAMHIQAMPPIERLKKQLKERIEWMLENCVVDVEDAEAMGLERMTAGCEQRTDLSKEMLFEFYTDFGGAIEGRVIKRHKTPRTPVLVPALGRNDAPLLEVWAKPLPRILGSANPDRYKESATPHYSKHRE